MGKRRPGEVKECHPFNTEEVGPGCFLFVCFKCIYNGLHVRKCDWHTRCRVSLNRQRVGCLNKRWIQVTCLPNTACMQRTRVYRQKVWVPAPAESLMSSSRDFFAFRFLTQRGRALFKASLAFLSELLGKSDERGSCRDLGGSIQKSGDPCTYTCMKKSAARKPTRSHPCSHSPYFLLLRGGSPGMRGISVNQLQQNVHCWPDDT